MSQNTSLMFSESEAQFLLESRLARVATVSPTQEPHVVPVAYEFDGVYLYFCGWKLERSLKFRNIKRNPKVAIVVDDLESTNPWRPRGVEIRGIAEIMNEDGRNYIRITPMVKRSWGL